MRGPSVSIRVDRANEAEAPACLALLPEARGLAVQLLIARRDDAIAGAGAILWRSWSAPYGFPLWLHVLPAHRAAGVGQALLAGAGALARRETRGLWSATPVPEGGPAARFLTACGFIAMRRERHFQMRGEVLLNHLAPMTDRLRARGRIPAQSTITPLAQARLDEIGWLVSEQFGGGPVRALHGLRRRATMGPGHEGDRSIVALHRGEIAGVMLWRIVEGVAVVDARIVAPRWRGAWPNLVLLEATLRRAAAEGVAEFRFYCDESVEDTLKLAKRSGAEQVAAHIAYYYALN
jgi:GNAT superfamily N-acetyltransferase